MKKIRYIVIISLAAALLLSGCKKNKEELRLEDVIQVTETGYLLKGYQWYSTLDEFCKNIPEGMELTERDGKLDSIGKKSLSDTGEYEIWQAYRFQDALLYGYDYKIITQNEEEYLRLCEMLADKTEKLFSEPYSNPGEEGKERFQRGKTGRNWIGEDLSSVNIEFPYGDEGYYYIFIMIRAPHELWSNIG